MLRAARWRIPWKESDLTPYLLPAIPYLQEAHAVFVF